MRRAPKFRLLFLTLAVILYTFTNWLMPETLVSTSVSFSPGSDNFILARAEWQKVVFASTIYFVLLPILYWQWVIKVGEQPKWKILLVLSLSSLVARYQYPEQIAQYFEFIMYLRYPLIAVLLIIELYLMYTVIKSLWQARTLKGDPRVHGIIKFTEKLNNPDLDKKQKAKLERERDLSLAFAHEPASWFYAIPKFSKRHEPTITNLRLMSANFWHFCLITVGLTLATYATYVALVGFSETLALVVATIVFYCFIMFVANYRVSKHFSVYEMEQHLVVNDAWWGMLVMDINNIKSIELNETDVDKESLVIGREQANIKIELLEECDFYTAMAMVKDKVDHVYLSVDNPSALAEWFQQKTQTPSAA